MSTIQDLFQQAQLAEAAYAEFAAYPNDPIAALKKEGFSQAQADDFTTQWTLVNHLPDTVSGFSATLFQNTTKGVTH
jgi:hypothetical protein